MGPVSLVFLTVAAALPSLAVTGAGTPPEALAPGAHTTSVGGVRIAYDVAGKGPVVLAHPGGPGAEWSYLRMPELESLATVVYIEPVGTGASASREQLASIKAPTLVIVGRRDFVCCERWGRVLHENIKGSRLVVLHESGHMGHVEEPKAFASAVGDLLRALP